MRLIQIYACFCDETRLRLLHLLGRGPLCVCHFQEILQVPQVAVSKHLAYLKQRGLVQARRHEQWNIYSLPEPRPVGLDRQLRCLQDCAQTEEVFRKDLRRLANLRSECGWVAKALSEPDADNSRKAKSAKPARR